MLDTQYRMEPHIAAFLSKHMYMKKLKSAEGLYEQRKKICEKQPAKNMPISIADTTGMLTSFHRTISGSYFNILTAFCSVFLAQKPAESFDVGIIKPYREQAKLISSIIKDILETGKNVKIISSTVHSFQGSEQDIIIYDAPDCYIRPYPTQLLSDNKNQIADRLFNVAMSRAKGKFIALMNYDYLKGLLSKERLFSKFFVQQKQHKNEILNEQIFNTDKNVCLRKFNEEEAEQRFIMI